MRSTTGVYPFPDYVKQSYRLTVRDKLELHNHCGHLASLGLGNSIRQESEGLSHEYLQLHRWSDDTVAWTVVRTGARLTLWRGSSGAECGIFASMFDVLEAVLAFNETPFAPKRARKGRGLREGRRPEMPRAVLHHLPLLAVPNH